MFFYYCTGIFVIPVLIFSIYCQARVKSSYKKFSKVLSSRRITGAQAAQAVLQANGITNVSVVPIGGELTDNYNPKTNQISLSQGVFSSCSIAAIGIACHEAGHACQYAQEYSFIKIRSAIIPITQFGSYAAIPLAMIGLFISYTPLIWVGVILYSFLAFFQLVTLPVEFNASKRALEAISSYGFLNEEEYKGAKKVLTSAALTYVAALASVLVTLLRLVLLANRRR